MNQATHFPKRLPKAFDVIEADPNWPEKGGSQKCPKYKMVKHPMDVVGIMLRSSVWRPADDAHLWLWVTNNFMFWADDVALALGFPKHITTFTWNKLTSTGKKAKGIGQYSYGSTEHLCLFKRGRPPKPDPAFRRPTSFEGKLGEHSEKPIEGYETIESVSHKLPRRLSMFSRTRRPGWTVWGDEVPSK